MIIPAEIIDRLQEYGAGPWSGMAWRFVLGDRDPTRPSLRGGRWGTREGFAILYTSLSKDTAITEGEHLIKRFSIPPDNSWNIYQFEIELSHVVDISDDSRLAELGVDMTTYSTDWNPCPNVGAAANFLSYEGLIAPSARVAASNLMIFTENLLKESRIEQVLHQELRKDQR